MSKENNKFLLLDEIDKIILIEIIRRCEKYMTEIGVSHEYAIIKDIRRILKKMDKVITCICGCQSWVIGYSGTRCSKCGMFLESGSVVADIDSINNSLYNIADAMLKERDK